MNGDQCHSDTNKSPPARSANIWNPEAQITPRLAVCVALALCAGGDAAFASTAVSRSEENERGTWLLVPSAVSGVGVARH
jgi:hypothetical protein